MILLIDIAGHISAYYSNIHHGTILQTEAHKYRRPENVLGFPDCISDWDSWSEQFSGVSICY